MKTINQKWMEEPGKVKKLQLALIISLIFNALSLQQLIINKTRPIKKNIETKQIAKIDAKNIEDFGLNYINHFFGISEDDENFLKTHTDKDLFEEEIAKEILERKKLNLVSHFMINDKNFEQINEKTFRMTAIGQEIFDNPEYQARDCDIELIINGESLTVSKIPRFKAE